MAENPSIAYLNAEGATRTTTNYSFVSDSTSTVTWTTGIYVVGADYDGDGYIDGADATYAKANDKQTEFTISDMVTLSGDVSLIIADGFSLSVSAKDAEAGKHGDTAISSNDGTLTITAQSLGDDAGILTVTGGKGGAGNENEGKFGGFAISTPNVIVNAGNITTTGGQGGQGGVYDDQGKDGGNGGVALGLSDDLTINNGTLIANGGKGGQGGKGDESTGADGTTGQAIDASSTKITDGTLIMNGGTDAAGAYSGDEITNGTNSVKMYDLAGNELSFSSGTYKYGETPAIQLANIAPVGLASVSSLGEQGGVTFTVNGTETTKAWAGTTVTVAGVAVEGYYIAGFTSDQVTITDNTFVMPETAVTVTATYAKYDDRIVVDTATYAEGCTLENGKTYTAVPINKGNGGMVKVLAGGTLNTNGASFSGNSVTSSQDDGGAIYNQGTVNVSGGSFSSNSARHDGGAIYNKGGNTIISGTDFTGNYAKVLGGAITTSGGKLDITSATFANNVAGSNGGAIFNSSGCVATLTDVAFYGNAAKGIYSHEGGGAIENTRGGIMTLSNVTFDGNTAQYGGAIYNYTLGTINLTGSVDLQTDTDTWLNEGYYNSYYKTEENSVVNWNLTGVTDPAQSTVTINGFQRYSNKKTTYTDGSGTEVTNLLINQNITVNAEGAQAAGDYVLATGDFDLATLQTNLSTDFTVTDGTNNAAITVNGDTGSIGDQGYKLALVESTEQGADQLVLTVINYTAERIVMDTTTSLDTGKTYTAKPYEGKGGAFYVDENATLTGKDVTFADNAVTGNEGSGGAIYAEDTAVISLDGDIVFSGNTAMCGGAISTGYNNGLAPTLKFTGNSVSFINNTAVGSDAGAINVERYATLTFESSAIFSGNTTTSNGGAIFSMANITFNGTVDFSNNTAGKNGGAIYGYGISSSTVTLNDTATFTGNSATGNGGAIYNKQNTVNLNSETTFTGNTAGANGGAIYNQGTLNLNGKTTFNGNTVTGGASKGGAIFNAVNSTLNMANTVTLATETDTVYNGGTLNWNLTGETTGKLEGYQYLTNDGGTLQITVKEKQTQGEYVLATGNMTGYDTDVTGKYTFTLTGINGADDVAITVNDTEIEYGKNLYTLAISDNGTTEDLTDDKLVLTVKSQFGAQVDDDMEGKWFKAGETITITGTYTVDDSITSFTFNGNDVDYDQVAKTWSYTFASHDDTEGTKYDIVISTASGDSATATYTLKVDTEAPGANLICTNPQYVADGTYWYKWTSESAYVKATGNDNTSGVKGIQVDGGDVEANPKILGLDLSAELESAKTIVFNAVDNAGNTGENLSFTYNVDGTGPTISDVAFDGDPISMYDDGATVWFKKDSTATLTATIEDDRSGFYEATFQGGKYENGQFSVDTSTAGAISGDISATDKVGNTATENVSYKVDGTGPAITISYDPTSDNVPSVTVTANFTDDGGSGVATKQYSLDGGETWLDYTEAFIVTKNGEIQFKATDNVGNEGTESLTISNIDAIAPAITSWQNGDVVWAEATDNVKVTSLKYRLSESEDWLPYNPAKGVTVTSDNEKVFFKASDAAENETELAFKVNTSVIPPLEDPVSITGESLSWDGDKDAKVTITSEDGELQISTDKSGVNILGGDSTLKIGVEDEEGETLVDDTTKLHDTIPEEAEDTPVVMDASGATEDQANIFLARIDGTWSNGYIARHRGYIVGGQITGATKEYVKLAGLNKITDIFNGSENNNANTLALTDEGIGDVLFVDDIYSASAGDLAQKQARVANIQEVLAGAGNDIVDFTSQKFAYTGDGVLFRGGDGDDVIWANHGSNTLFGDAGDDQLVGADGDDILVGGIGNDTLNGNGGDDTFAYGAYDWGTDTILQSSGSSNLWFDGVARKDITLSNDDQGDAIFSYSTGAITLEGVAYADILDNWNNGETELADNLTVKFGDDGSEEYDNLVAADAFKGYSSTSVFASSNIG